ncbi:hypothetical protein FN846DRAFT_1013848 [Sphaerosporella brunnea]|uniref:Uncharacterized protein n=1 Tax=Sphaerosporella brunnea TaxID=1250544 RepID=A0A5J5F9F8_9PEZI|nr:hypothetical protein FN846DRAFT_1013848 [Sphaerosporella brunnea]
MSSLMGNSNYKDLSEDLGLDSIKVREDLENYFIANEQWLCDRANHTKWNSGCVDRLIATKTITTDEWLQKAVELGHMLGVETSTLERPALHSLHLLLKKKVDEKLAVQTKRARAAAKDRAAGKKGEAAEKGLEAATTLADAADQVVAPDELRSSGATLEAAAPRTRSDAADQERQLIKHRTDGALREEEAANLRYDAADQETQLMKHRTDGALSEEEAANLRYNSAKGEEEVMKKVAALRLKAAENEAEAARVKLEREKNEAAAAEIKLARERLLYQQAAASGSASAPSSSTASSSASGASSRFAPSRFARGGLRLVCDVPAQGRSTTQDRAASGSSTEVADEQDAV